MAKHDMEIRRYLSWRKKVKGKPIQVRIYEVIYVGLTMLWSKMGKSSLRTTLDKFVERNEYRNQLMSGRLFQEVIDKIIANPNEDRSGYHLPDSGERMSYEDIKQLKKIKNVAIKELSTNKLAKRYEVVFRMCESYEAWALNKKLQESGDITKQATFETFPTLPLTISSKRI